MFDQLQRSSSLELLRDWSSVRWKIAIVGVGLLGMSLLGMMTYQIADQSARLLWAAFGGLFGGLAGLTGGLTLYLALQSHQRLEENESEFEKIRGLVNVRPLMGKLPLDLGGWAADPVLADRMVRLLLDRNPRQVVECGSGWSTVVMAKCLDELGEGRILALEHSKHYASQTRDLIRRHRVSDRARIAHSPIKNVQIEGEAWPWYGIEPDDLVDAPIDILLVDGPPGNLAPRSRYPAVPMLKEFLADRWTVILDDGHRADETWIAARWEECLGVEASFNTMGNGVYEFTSPASAGQSKGE